MSDFVRNFDDPAFDCTGQRIVDDQGNQLSYGCVLSGIVKQRWKGEETLDYKKLYERGSLAVRIHRGGDIELTAQEIAELQHLIELSQLPPGQAFGLLAILRGDGAPEPLESVSNGRALGR